MVDYIPILFIAVIGEIAVLSTCGFVIFSHSGNTFAEAASYAVISVFMALSIIHQLHFMVGWFFIGPILELSLAVSAIIVCWKLRRTFKTLFLPIAYMFSVRPWILSGVVLAWLALFFHAFIVQAPIPDNEHFRQLMMLQAHQPIFSIPYTDGLYPINAVVLFHHFMRLPLHFGFAIPCFMAYLSIGFSTYALARRYAWSPAAFTISLIVLSMPRLVYLATIPNEEIIVAASALFCLLAMIRAVEVPNIRDLLLLLVGISFTISTTSLILVFPGILILLGIVTLARRHGVITWKTLIVQHGFISAATLLPLTIFSQIRLFVYNHHHFGKWFILSDSFIRNADGIKGMAANAIRYCLQSVHFTQPVESFFNNHLHLSLTNGLHFLHSVIVAPLFGDLGLAAPFVVDWKSPKFFWFGPFGNLLVMPALGYALFQGPRRLKTTAIALTGYFYVIALVAAWRPGNVEFFTIFFTCGGYFSAIALPPWRLGKNGRKWLQSFCLILILQTLIFIL